MKPSEASPNLWILVCTLLLSQSWLIAEAKSVNRLFLLQRAANEIAIHTIQGTGPVSPLNGTTVSVRAVVTGDFQFGDSDLTRNLGGFYLQEADANADNKPATSEGIFVNEGLKPLVDVKVGDLVVVSGVVQEYFGETQIVPTSVNIIGANYSLPKYVQVRLLSVTSATLSQDGYYQPDLEAYEGMLVKFPETLQITDQYNLDRFNEIKLVAGPRPYAFTQTSAPNVQGYNQSKVALGKRRITYDDGLNLQYAPIGQLEGFGPVYSTANAKRMGDNITGMHGVLSYQWAGNASSGATWRVRSIGDPVKNSFLSAYPRTASPPQTFPDGLIKIVSLNVLNFFTTLDKSGNIGSGPNRLQPRGANSQQELDRQLQKLVTAILALDSDIMGLSEIENEFGSDRNGDGRFAILTLVNALNAGKRTNDTFSYIDPGSPYIGTDAIAVSIIYKSNKVVPVGDPAILTSAVDSRFLDTKNRPSLAQSFRGVKEPSSSCMTVVVNHLKSKGSACTDVGDPDIGGGAGNCNLVRTNAALALASWANNDPTGTRCTYVALVGDFNSYAQEDPIKALQSNGFTSVEKSNAYSYVFDSQIGTLDYIFMNYFMRQRLGRFVLWHGNEDEAAALDYNLDNGRDPSIFDGSSPARSSDHSPLVAGFLQVLPTYQEVSIHAVQGNSSESPLIGKLVRILAVVTGDFQELDADRSRSLQGFFAQEVEAKYDSNPLTSEGIFVFDGPTPATDVKLGDLVAVIGTVTEYYGETQIIAASVDVIFAGLSLPSYTNISLLSITNATLSQDGDYQPDLEAYEGMLVRFPDALQITEQYNLARFNEIKLVAGPRPIQFTQLKNPDPLGYQKSLIDLGLRRITYDDGLNQQNALIGLLEGFGPTYNNANAKRMGDVITGLHGALSYQWAGSSSSGATWRVRSIGDSVKNTFASANPRLEKPPPFSSQLIKIASTNVLNFFTTLDVTGNKGSGPKALPPRGANTQQEFDRQLQKLVSGIIALDADILGLMEIENEFGADRNGDGKFAIGSLISSLNSRSTDKYAYVNPGVPYLGTDAIAVALIYKTAKITLVGQPGILNSTVDIRFNETKNRPSLAQSFRGVGEVGSRCITVVANHLKSKGSSCDDVGDPDLGNGAGNCNLVRTRAAEALAAWANGNPTGFKCSDVLLLGDFNSYAQEDPIKTLQSNGFASVETKDAYSFVFDGQIGTLDYMFTNNALGTRLDQATVWHINEDEATALDYNLDYGRDAKIFNGTSAARYSDHSPLIAGFKKSTSVTPAPTSRPTLTPFVLLNEFVGRTDASGGAEFIELYGSPNLSLNGLSIVIIDQDAGASTYGQIVRKVDFGSRDRLGLCDGYYLIANPNSLLQYYDKVPDKSLPAVENYIKEGNYIIAIMETSSVGNVGSIATGREVRRDAFALTDGDTNFLYNLRPYGPDGTQSPPGLRRSPDGSNTVVYTSLTVSQNNPRKGRFGNCAPTGAPTNIPLFKIHEIQGSGSFSPLYGRTVIVEAIVISDNQQNDADPRLNLQGFWLQEEVRDYDKNNLTSEGIFVVDGPNPTVDVNLGDLVRVSGKVDEVRNETRIVSVTSVEVLSSNQPLPPMTDIYLLQNRSTIKGQDGRYTPDLEAYEGMLVRFPETFQITEQYQLARFNEIKVVVGPRPYTFSQLNRPDPVALDKELRRQGQYRLTYDDGNDLENLAPIGYLEGFGPTYLTANAPRMGDTIVGLNGVLSYQWAGSGASLATWRVRNNGDSDKNVVNRGVNPRTYVPPAFDAGLIKVVSLNVLNFFTTLFQPGNPGSGPNNLDARGAESQLEFDRQIEKLVTEIIAFDADIIGLLEIENEYGDQNGDGQFALGELVEAINKRGIWKYNFVNPLRPAIGTDAISVSFLYKTEKIVLVGQPAILTSRIDPDFIDNRSRPPLAQSFRGVVESGCITLCINHLKSKGSGCEDIGDPDVGGGAGNCNLTRNKAAAALAKWLAKDPTGTGCPDVGILGDLNSYAMEDPIQTLKSYGYTSVEPPEGYSYVFDGGIGTLDYTLVNPSLLKRLKQAVVWHVNEDEAVALDFDLGFNRDPTIFDGTVPARSSDHSPVISGYSKVSNGTATVYIHQVQGVLSESLYAGVPVRVTGIVVGDFQNNDADAKRNLQGFYLEEEQVDWDRNPLTSEGIFIWDGPSPKLDVNVGDVVTVVGMVMEISGETQINATSVTKVSSGNPLPPLINITLSNFSTATLDGDGNYQPDFEAYEGMLVQFPEALYIVQQDNLNRFNEITLQGGTRPYHYSQLNSPSTEGYVSYLQQVGSSRITYDDGLNEQYQPITFLEGFGPVYNTATAWRNGDTITGLRGVLSYTWAGDAASGAKWRLRSTGSGVANKFNKANARPSSPIDFGALERFNGVKIASVNLLNFFTTISGTSGPNQQAPRGASTVQEYNRQLQKLVTGLLAIDADILGLAELENEYRDSNGDGKLAIRALVNALNTAQTSDQYAYVDPKVPFLGSDVIAVGLIYKINRVAEAGTPAIMNSTVDPTFIDTLNRPTLVQSFQRTGPLSMTCITVAMNHLKSKGSPCDAYGDVDQRGGAGNCNQVRTSAIRAVYSWLATGPTGTSCSRTVIMGDLNSYAQEDPIVLLRGSGGYYNAETTNSYSYVYDGKIGTLDYLFVKKQGGGTPSVRSGVWHINEDEADALDYNLDNGRDATIFNATSPARFSDHSPVVAILPWMDINPFNN